MKIQHLAVIFLLIILPIDIVLSLYIDKQINTLELQSQYDSKLVGCVYDALEVFQSNAITDTEADIVNVKMNNIEASASTFLTTLQTSFGFSGYKSTVMQEYVPAVVYTMYDGYYIYSKFNNTLSERYVYKDSSYKDGDTIEGVKSYVYYSCRYQREKNGKQDDFVITYTLDNYITIQGIIQGDYVNRSGYLIDGITCISPDSYKYDGIIFTKDGNKESLTELVGSKFYPYVKINGTKYYYEGNDPINPQDEDRIFSMINGTKTTTVKYGNDPVTFKKYRDAIYENKSAYQYYKEAYEFTNWVRKDCNLGDLTSKQAGYSDESGNFVPITDFGNYTIFGDDDRDTTTGKESNGYIQDSNSDFNQHRAAVIRYTVETNLTAAIAGFSNYSDQIEFAMPKISETDWDIIENNVCIIGFLQGLDLGTKKYNGYAVAANTTTDEYVDEDAIYIVTENDKQYHRANSEDLYNIIYSIGSSSGVFKVDFERNYVKENNGGVETKIYYYPKSPSEKEIYSASYSSIIMQTSVNTEYDDMYQYMRSLNGNNASEIKKEYYTALARERYGSYKVSHDKEYSYFLNNY